MYLIAFPVALALLYVVICGFIAFGFAVRSRSVPGRTPSSYGVAYEEAGFLSRTDGISLSGWFLPGERAVTVIVIPGGKQNRADETMGLLPLCAGLAGTEFNVLTFDRRSCGVSGVSRWRDRGRLHRDLGGALDYIREKRGPGEKVFVFGISVGALAACTLAAHEAGISGLILDSCFVTKKDIARRTFERGMKYSSVFVPLSLTLGMALFGLPRADAKDLVGGISCPILFINGGEDFEVPPEDTINLAAASDNPADEVFVAPGARHSQAYLANPAEYIDRLTSFILRH